MKKLLIATALCALFAAPGLAAPITMNDAQLDGVSAGFAVGNGNDNGNFGFANGNFNGNVNDGDDNGNFNFGAFNGNGNGNFNLGDGAMAPNPLEIESIGGGTDGQAVLLQQLDQGGGHGRLPDFLDPGNSR